MARTYGKDIMEAALRNHSNVLLTIHGAPLTYSTKTQDENIKGIVPENCILIIITPPQAVVFSSPVEDTETYRFFQQKNWIKTLLGGTSENCYGADRYVSENATERVEPMDTEDDKKDDDSDSDMDTDGGDVTFHEKGKKQDIIRAKIRKKNDMLDHECEEVLIYSTAEDIKRNKKFLKRAKSNNSEQGFELLNNIQIFLPGDEFYNQFQEFDDESQDFNAYYLGQPKDDYRFPLSGNPEDETLVYPYFQYDGGNDVETLVSKKKNGVPVPWRKGQHITTGTHKVEKLTEHQGANYVPYFHRNHPFANHELIAAPKTTQQILDYIMNKSEEAKENNGLPKIVILNSCSPSKEVAKKKSKSFTKILEARIAKKYQDMKHNLAYRGKIYWQGRKRFCALRHLVAWDKTALIEPLLPYWDGHNQFTRIDKEDLASTHKFIGDMFAEEHEARLEWIANNKINVDDYPNHGIGPITFGDDLGNELFFGLYTVAATDRRQTIMRQLREDWSRTFGSGKEQAWSWENMVDSWEEMRRIPLGAGPTAVAGGGKKRRRTRKRRRKTRKKKKNRKKRTKKKARNKRRRCKSRRRK
jgi:hypothetical protein